MPTSPPLVTPPHDCTWTWWRLRTATSIATINTFHTIPFFGLAGANTWAAALTANAIPKLRACMTSDWTIEELQIFSWSLGTQVCGRVVPINLAGQRTPPTVPAEIGIILYWSQPVNWWRDAFRWYIPGSPTNVIEGRRMLPIQRTRVNAFGTAILSVAGTGFTSHLTGWSRKFNTLGGVLTQLAVHDKTIYMRRRRPRTDHQVWPIYPTI